MLAAIRNTFVKSDYFQSSGMSSVTSEQSELCFSPLIHNCKSIGIPFINTAKRCLTGY